MTIACQGSADRTAAIAMRSVLALILGAAIASGASAAGAPVPAPTPVPVEHAGRKCFIRSVHATGYILPRAAAVVMFNSPDFRISDLLVKAGDVVERGDVVAKAVSMASRSGGGASGTEVSIRSLASGLVLTSAAFVGMPTSAQAGPLFTLALDGEMEAGVDVPAIHVFELENGQLAHVDMRDGTSVDGRLRLAPHIIDTSSQSGQARIAFAPDVHLTPGRFVRATIEANRSCGIGIPRAALTKSSEGPRVQVVVDDVVATRAVELGLASDVEFEVTKGLREGDVVVADAGTGLREGDRIKPIFAEGQDSP